MTREQAINYLFSCGFTNEQVCDVVRALTYEPTTKNNLGVDCVPRGVVERIIKSPRTQEQMLSVLDSVPSVASQPCEDAISRQAVLDMAGLSEWFDSSDSYNDFAIAIEKLPSVIPQEPTTGDWIIKDGKEQGYDIGGVKTWYIQIMCSGCGFIKTAIEGHTGQYHYCPNCGAKMFEPQESENEDGNVD